MKKSKGLVIRGRCMGKQLGYKKTVCPYCDRENKVPAWFFDKNTKVACICGKLYRCLPVPTKKKKKVCDLVIAKLCCELGENYKYNGKDWVNKYHKQLKQAIALLKREGK